MSFLSATRFGKKVCISYHKVNEILFNVGLYDKELKKPTEYAFQNGFAEMRSLESKYESGMTEYIAWDSEKIIQFFTAPSDREKAIYFTNRNNALDKVLSAFHDLDAIVYADENRHSYVHYVDMHLFLESAKVADIDKLTAQTMAVANDLRKKAIKTNAPRANLAFDIIESAFVWLRQAV